MHSTGRAGDYELQSTGISNFQFKRFLEEEIILVPTLSEQKRRSGVLAALDEKLAHNRRTVKMMERLLQLGLEKTLQAQPWPQEPIGDLLPLKGGGTPSTKEPSFWGGAYHWVTPKDLSLRPITPLLETSRMLTRSGVDRVSSGLLPKETVLMSSRAPVGFTTITKIETAINQGFIAVPPNEAFPSAYTLCWIRRNLDQIKAYAGGSTFAEISKKNFKAIPMEKPSQSALKEFDAFATPILDLIESLEREGKMLSRARAALLPKVVSGEIEVLPDYDPSGVLHFSGPLDPAAPNACERAQV